MQYICAKLCNMVSIYALIDSRDNTPFYIGRSTFYLPERLKAHLGERNKRLTKCTRQHTIDKQNRINAILESGYKVEIIPLLKCSPKSAILCEAYIYNLLIDNDCTLLQSPLYCHYKK